MEKLYMSAKRRLGADCGSDLQLLIAKLRLQLKKVGKTTRPLTYDLNQIPCDYTVEVTNRFKGLDLADRASQELCIEVYNTCSQPCTGGSDQNHPREKEIQEGKVIV